jgi:hypothetical protein
MPTTCIQKKYFQELFKDERISIIYPYKKINYDKYLDGSKVERNDNCSFYSCYIYWGIDLPRDNYFI